jgi:hypothetical protein
MRAIFQKIWSLPVVAGGCILLLQSYIFMYGCSNNAIAPEITGGRALYSSKCVSCHRLLPPEDYSADSWEHYVDKYGKKMTDDQKQIVLNYLLQESANAQKSQQEHPQ